MTKSSLAFASITSLSQGLHRKEFEVEDLLDSLLDNIRKREQNIRAYLHLVDEKTLRSQARQAGARFRDGSTKKLTGMFLAVKDNTDVGGLPCTGGSKILQGSVPVRDAHLVSKLKDEGAIFLGKTNLDEMAAFGIATNNPHFGRTYNP